LLALVIFSLAGELGAVGFFYAVYRNLRKPVIKPEV